MRRPYAARRARGEAQSSVRDGCAARRSGGSLRHRVAARAFSASVLITSSVSNCVSGRGVADARTAARACLRREAHSLHTISVAGTHRLARSGYDGAGQRRDAAHCGAARAGRAARARLVQRGGWRTRGPGRCGEHPLLQTVGTGGQVWTADSDDSSLNESLR